MLRGLRDFWRQAGHNAQPSDSDCVRVRLRMTNEACCVQVAPWPPARAEQAARPRPEGAAPRPATMASEATAPKLGRDVSLVASVEKYEVVQGSGARDTSALGKGLDILKAGRPSCKQRVGLLSRLLGVLAAHQQQR